MILIGLALALSSNGCIDPVPPDFEYREGLIFVEGFGSTLEGESFVSVNVSAIEFGVEVVNHVSGATVILSEQNSGREVILSEIPGAYIVPSDFRLRAGEAWKLDIIHPDGRHFQSTYESIDVATPITDIRASYKPQLVFRESSDAYVPGHEIFIDFSDPGDKKNYYYWRYRVFENLDNCERCFDGIFREGRCRSRPDGTILDYYYDYQCESDCWKIRYPEEVQLLDDRFINGRQVQSQLVANIPMFTREDMVVEIQQLSISPKAYEYYRVLQDLIDNNGGINAPPPAALIGNLRDVEDDDAFVFGRFTVAGSTSAYVFVDRTNIEETPIEPDIFINREECEVCPRGSACNLDCTPVTTAACTETRYRTSMMPQGWVQQ